MKNLIFLAGPHRSDSSEVNDFFYKHATGTDENGLEGWRWPEVEGELPGEKYQYFENFFWNQNNNTIQKTLMQGIQGAWEESEHGIIIGADGFDNTRGNPESAGLKTMNKIIGSLAVPPQNVYVVMMYKSPRLDQWANLFHHNSDGNYNDFVCNEKYSEHLANIDMNPLMLSTVFRAQGWNVAVVDTVGASSLGWDIGHSIACQLLPMVDCHDGWIRDLQDQRTQAESSYLQEFKWLPEEKKTELEGMFLARDCHYQNLLESDDAFVAIHKKTLWNDCDSSLYSSSRYQQLTDADHFFALIQKQVGCDQFKDPVSLPGPQGGNIGWNELTVSVLALAIVSFLFVAYTTLTHFKLRQIQTVRSPKRTWIDFSTDNINLSPSKDNDEIEICFDDVELRSPVYANQQRMVTNTAKATSILSATARQGKSVRGVYKFGLRQDSRLVKTRPPVGDAEFEHQIEVLEAEIA